MEYLLSGGKRRNGNIIKDIHTMDYYEAVAITGKKKKLLGLDV